MGGEQREDCSHLPAPWEGLSEVGGAQEPLGQLAKEPCDWQAGELVSREERESPVLGLAWPPPPRVCGRTTQGI